MNDDHRDDADEKKETSRRGFFRVLGGTLVGAGLIGEAEAQIRGPIKRVPGKIIHRPELKVRPGMLQLKKTEEEPTGGDETPIPYIEDQKPDPDDPPDFGPLVVMAAPGYDPTPSGTQPYIYANRFFEKWDETAPNWFGAGQLGVMKSPSWGWLTTTPPPPEWCAVSTVWNKGREPAYGVMMRCLCFAMAKVAADRWQEACRADLGYVHIGTLTPGDFMEVRYPVTTVRDGMKALDDFLVAEDPQCNRFPDVWYFQKCFAFDPLADPLTLQPPIEAPDPPRRIIGGRHGAGWRWEVAAQTPGTNRVRHFA